MKSDNGVAEDVVGSRSRRVWLHPVELRRILTSFHERFALSDDPSLLPLLGASSQLAIATDGSGLNANSGSTLGANLQVRLRHDFDTPNCLGWRNNGNGFECPQIEQIPIPRDD